MPIQNKSRWKTMRVSLSLQRNICFYIIPYIIFSSSYKKHDSSIQGYLYIYTHFLICSEIENCAYDGCSDHGWAIYTSFNVTVGLIPLVAEETCSRKYQEYIYNFFIMQGMTCKNCPVISMRIFHMHNLN